MENQNSEQVKTETNNAAPTDGIMVVPVPETSAPVQEPAAETPVQEAPVTSEPVAEPTVAEPQPVVIPKGEKPKSNKKKPNPILIILALVILAGAGYYEYVHFVKPIINDIEASANNNLSSGETGMIDIDSATTDENNSKITGDEIKKLVDKYYKYFDGKYSLINMLSNFNESTKAGIAFRNLSYADNNIKIAGGETTYESAKELVSYTDLNANYKKLFGITDDLSKEVRLDTGACIRTRYVSDTDSYVGSSGSCCGCGEGTGYYNASEYSIKDNKLYVVLNYIEYYECSHYKNDSNGSDTICGDVRIENDNMATRYALVMDNRVYPITLEIANNKNYLFSNYKNLITKKFKLTFEEKDGEYILVNSEQIANATAETSAYNGKKYITGTKMSDIKENDAQDTETNNEIYETLPIDNASIGENLTIRNIRYTTKEESGFTVAFGTHTFDIYLDDKLLIKDFTNNDGLSITEYKGTFLKKIGDMKDTETDADYFAFSVGSTLSSTLYIIDKEGKIYFQKDGSKDANAVGFILKETKERYKTGDYNFISVTNANTTIDLVLYYSADYTKNEGIVNSVKISSGKAVESVYKTYTSDEIESLTGR